MYVCVSQVTSSLTNILNYFPIPHLILRGFITLIILGEEDK
jgi:hypothetical protein